MDEQKPRRLRDRRRRENVQGGRPRRHIVRVSAEEEGVLLRLAGRQGVTVPRLLVESALATQDELAPAARRELLVALFTLHRAVGAVGNNLNQIARAANATGEIGEDLAHTLAAVRRQLSRIDDVMDGLGPR